MRRPFSTNKRLRKKKNKIILVRESSIFLNLGSIKLRSQILQRREIPEKLILHLRIIVKQKIILSSFLPTIM